jgi:hypothetical protein
MFGSQIESASLFSIVERELLISRARRLEEFSLGVLLFEEWAESISTDDTDYLLESDVEQLDYS